MAWFSWKIKLKTLLVGFILLLVYHTERTNGNDKFEKLAPCFKPKTTKNKYTEVKWYQSGHLYSYCNHVFKSSTTNRTSCLSVCTKQLDMTKGKVNCLLECTSEKDQKACQLGCNMYNIIFHQTGKRTINATRIPTSRPITIKERWYFDNVTLKWNDVKSKDSLISSIYVVTIKQTQDSSKNAEYILGLTKSPTYTITTNDMKSNMYQDDIFGRENMTFTIRVYPLNFNGPLTIENSKTKKLFGSVTTAPQKIDPVKGLNVRRNSPHYDSQNKAVIWDLGWNSTSIDQKRSNGIRFKPILDSCPSDDIKSKVLNENFGYFEQFYDANDYCAIKVNNGEDDTLRGCKIKVKVYVKYAACFLSNPIEYLIKYESCLTVKNYTAKCVKPTPPLRDTSLKKEDINVTRISRACNDTSRTIIACPDDGNFNCRYCTRSVFNVTATWNLANVPYEILAVKFRYGLLDLLGLKDDKIMVLAPNTTSYTFNVSSVSDDEKYGFQVFAKTPYSKKYWMSSADVTELELDRSSAAERVRSPHHDGEKKQTVMVTLIVVAVILLVAGIIWKIHRKRTSSSSSLSSDKVIMTLDNVAVITDDWEINPHHIKTIEKIGEGAFGQVYSATITTSAIMKSNFSKRCGGALLLSDKMKTAVKFLKSGAQDEEINDFKEEISLMKNIGYHKNIVNIIGSCTVKQPLCIVFEYMANGNLLDYLRAERNKRLNKAVDPEINPSVAVEDLMSYAWQISKGMEFLESKSVIHRDLAARNILVGYNNLVKISDFGLSRQYSHDPIYVGVSVTRRLPLKWMSVEAILHKEFTSASDVWSFGVVLFEIVTFGGTPYPFIGHRELVKLLKSGYRMEKPENCGQELYDVMCHCWNAIANQRPTFTELREHFEEIIENDGERYFSFDIDTTKAYYNVASFKSIPTDDEDDVLDEEYDPTQVQVKPLGTVKAVDVAVNLDYGGNSNANKQDNGDKYEGTDDETERYITPQSLKSDHLGSPSSYDNHNFHFHE